MAPGRVILHDLPLSFRQRMPFIENPVLDKKLADVMEHACHVCLSSGETEVFIAANNNIPGNLGGQDWMSIEMKIACMKALLNQNQWIVFQGDVQGLFIDHILSNYLQN